jgi:hypothetical protein
MAEVAYYSEDVQEMFDMDGIEQPFEMEDDYGFYEDLDTDDEDETVGVVPLPSDDEESALSIPVCGSRIEDENAESLRTSPPILTPFMVDAIAEDGLPWSMQETQWDRLFSSSRDGASFGTFMRRVRGHGQTIIVAKTSEGKVVGGYATNVWSGRKQPAGSQEDSHAFLFMVEPPAAKTKRPTTPVAHTFIPGLEELSSSPTSALDFDFHQLSVSSPKPRGDKPHVEFFKPSQKQHANAGFKQACQLGNKLISMSDGNGDLNLVIENSFSRGGVSRSGEAREDFTIVEFEVYGFSED